MTVAAPNTLFIDNTRSGKVRVSEMGFGTASAAVVTLHHPLIPSSGGTLTISAVSVVALSLSLYIYIPLFHFLHSLPSLFLSLSLTIYIYIYRYLPSFILSPPSSYLSITPPTPPSYISPPLTLSFHLSSLISLPLSSLTSPFLFLTHIRW